MDPTARRRASAPPSTHWNGGKNDSPLGYPHRQGSDPGASLDTHMYQGKLGRRAPARPPPNAVSNRRGVRDAGFASAVSAFAKLAKDQNSRSRSAGRLPFRRRRCGPKSSSSAIRDKASSISSVSEVTCARRLAASSNLADTLPDSRAALAAPSKPD